MQKVFSAILRSSPLAVIPFTNEGCQWQRCKSVDMSPRFLPVVLEQQIVPGTFKHALHVLIDTEFALSSLHGRFSNDAAGAPAYGPAILFKIVLLAYSRGIISSRAIERACRRTS